MFVDAIYNSAAPTATDGKNIQLQADANGNLKVTGGGTAGTPSGGVQSVQGVSGGTALNVVTQPNEAVTYVSTTSAQVISSGWSIAGAVALSGGFVSGASYASLRDISVGVIGSQSANITATILRGATVSSVVAAGSAVSFHLADAKQVIGPPIVLAPAPLAGATASGGATAYGATGIDLVVPNGGQIVLMAGASMTLPGTATSSGVTVGTGVA